MRILLLSDIHSNIAALDSVLTEAADKWDKIWCLGDVVGYGPAPNECVERLRDLGAESLAGNHDRAVLGRLDIEDFNTNAQRAIKWTQDALKSESRAWLDRLPELARHEQEELTLVHGSPRGPVWEYILSTMTAAENLSFFDTRACLFGHTHVPILFYQPAVGSHISKQPLTPGEPITWTQYAKCLLNPGSVGQPRDRDPRAAFAILDLDARTCTPYRVEYEIARTQQAMAEARLPHQLIERLQYGV